MDNNELLKYLTEDDKKRIAEKVYEEEIRKEIKEDLDKRDPDIFNNQDTIYERILQKYINEMDLYKYDFIDIFKKKVLEEAKHIATRDRDDADGNNVFLEDIIEWRLKAIGEEVIDESKEDLKPIIKEKVFKCCNETLLIAFLSDIVRKMNLDEAVKKIIKETEGDKV